MTFTVRQKCSTFDDAPRLASRISAQNCLHKQSTVRNALVKWLCLRNGLGNNNADDEGISLQLLLLA